MKRQRKGIALTKSYYLNVKELIDDHHEQILDWLGVTYVPENIQKYSDDQENALNVLEFLTGEINSSIKFSKNDNMFYQSNFLGNLEKIIYNKNHPFTEELDKLSSESVENKLLKSLIDALIIAYEKSKMKFADTPVSNPSILFENLERNWSEYLKRYIEEGD